MRIIHIWKDKRHIQEVPSRTVTYCNKHVLDLFPSVGEDTNPVHYAVDEIWEEYIPDLCEECLEYEGAQMVLLAGTEL